MKKLLICLLFPLAAFPLENPIPTSSHHRFYVQPEAIMGEMIASPAVALGYRYRKGEFGVDAGVHLLPISTCGQWGVLPLPKLSVLGYPGQGSFYLGGGLLLIAPCGTIGYEVTTQESGVLCYVQVDAFYYESPFGILSLGLGF